MTQFRNDCIRRKLKVHQTPITWNRLSACRFLFYRFQNSGGFKEQGDLYYTDNHYGHNLINADLLDNTCGQCRDKIHQGERYVRKIQKLCHHCRYKLMQRTIANGRGVKFPFTKLGNMTLKKHDTGSLDDIKLQQVYVT